MRGRVTMEEEEVVAEKTTEPGLDETLDRIFDAIERPFSRARAEAARALTAIARELMEQYAKKWEEEKDA